MFVQESSLASQNMNVTPKNTLEIGSAIRHVNLTKAQKIANAVQGKAEQRGTAQAYFEFGSHVVKQKRLLCIVRAIQ